MPFWLVGLSLRVNFVLEMLQLGGGKGDGLEEWVVDGREGRLGSCHAERSRSICTVVYEQILRLRSG